LDDLPFRFKRERDRRTVIRPPPDPANDKRAPLIIKKHKKLSFAFDNRLVSGNGKSLRPMIGRKKRRSKETAETKRERKAWRTLAIITGTFVACWTPFFLVSLYRPICRCTIPRAVETVTAWLGYLNSALNPIIYTVFSQDFRAAFKKILKRLCLLKEY
uniref:G_PROTEIN_RECEP_F1_2 domain-containing protein n=1 Tax=Heligmosomoides polygyrus TaxID=6339 RepID=A0A183G9I9_HELPZ